jgi:hypothetical protein
MLESHAQRSIAYLPHAHTFVVCVGMKGTASHLSRAYAHSLAFVCESTMLVA